EVIRGETGSGWRILFSQGKGFNACVELSQMVEHRGFAKERGSICLIQTQDLLVANERFLVARFKSITLSPAQLTLDLARSLFPRALLLQFCNHRNDVFGNVMKRIISIRPLADRYGVSWYRLKLSERRVLPERRAEN